MLDFSENIYRKILNLAVRRNFIAHCREYPFLKLNSHLLSPATVQEKLRKNFENPNFSCGLYIHFPFCKSRCAFCKYYAETCFSPEIIDEYLNALEREIELYGVNFSNIVLANIYFGGGTPTLLSMGQIEKLQKIIFKFFRSDKKTQISIEGTPDSIKLENLKRWRELGVNRISLGCQTFNDKILRKIGRWHSVKDIFRSFDIVKRSGIRYTGIDLIFGLPGENLKSYKKTIGSAIKLSPDFIECFLLTEGGLTKIQCSQPMDGGNLDHIIRLFKEEFTQNGYRIYFSGNFLGFVKKHLAGSSAMNQNTEGVYNQRVFCLALGPSGLSQFPFLKYTISPNLNNYLKQCLTEKRLPDFYGFLLNKDDERRQYIISRIGYYRFIDKKDYFRLFGTSLKGDFPAEINYLIKNRIISESKQSFIWHLNEHEMGHEAFFLHVLKYWYPPRHIRQLIENLNKIRREKVLA